MSCISSVILFLMPFMLSCRILKSLGLIDGCLRVEVSEVSEEWEEGEVEEEDEEVGEEEERESEDWMGDGGESLSVVCCAVDWVELVVWLDVSEIVEDGDAEVSDWSLLESESWSL